VVYRLVSAPPSRRFGTPDSAQRGNDECRDQQQQPRWRLMTPFLPTPLNVRSGSVAGPPPERGATAVRRLIRYAGHDQAQR
jgi:hypothetical protein